MTERSFFYDGTTKGDAQEAPYDADTFSLIEGLLHTSNGAYGNPPTVTANGANMNLTVTAGSALVRGRYIVAAGNPITVPSNTSTLSRIDRVVFRVNLTSYQGDVILKQGTPNYAPVPAELIQNDDIYEMPLYRVNVLSGATALQTYDVIDEREFYAILVPSSTQWEHSENVMPNSEFMAGAGTGYGNVPAMWSGVGTASCAIADKFEQMPRGSTVEVTCPANGDGISFTVLRLSGTGSGKQYTLRLLIDVSEGTILVNTGVISARILPTSGPTEVILRTSYNTSMQLAVTNFGTTQAVFKLGQVTLSQGYAGAAFLPKRETILFSNPITPDGYSMSDSILTTPRTIEILLTNLVSGGQSPLCEGLSALLTRLEVKDSGSGGTNTSYASLQDFTNNTDQLRVEIGRVTNSIARTKQGIIGVPFDSAGDQRYQLKTDGGGTLTAGIFHLGCRT